MVVKEFGGAVVQSVRIPACHAGGRGFESRFSLHRYLSVVYAQVAELVDAHVSGACVERHAGSSPVLGTLFIQNDFMMERWRNW